MLRFSSTLQTHVHASLEENLLSAKRALKNYRGARIHRQTESADEVLDIVVGAEIVERHVFRLGREMVREAGRIRLCVENMALYQ